MYVPMDLHLIGAHAQCVRRQAPYVVTFQVSAKQILVKTFFQYLANYRSYEYYP